MRPRPEHIRGPLIPALLRPGDDHGLATAELAAAALDGDLVRVGEVYLPVDQPSGPVERAASLRPRIIAGSAAARDTAAWIWGARWRCPEPIALYLSPGARSRAPESAGAASHEVLLEPCDVVELDGVAVTSMLRTALDLARAAERDFDQQTLGRLLAIAGLDPADIVGELERRPRIPDRRLALRRLQVLFTR